MWLISQPYLPWVFLDGWLIAASHLFCGPGGKTPFFLHSHFVGFP